MLQAETGAAARGCIRVVIAEDQAMVLGALAALLEMEGDIKVIAQVRNGREAIGPSSGLSLGLLVIAAGVVCYAVSRRFNSRDGLSAKAR